jgi:ClpP class serine protease
MKALRSLPRIAARIYAEPWLIRESKHESIRSQFRAALDARQTGARTLLSASDDENDYAPKLQQRAEMDCLAHLEIEQGIAIVPVTGILGKHLDMLETLCGGYDLDTLNAQCLALMNRADVQTVVFHFNTPGGAAAGVADSAQCLLDLAASGRKLIAYCDEACSGGMWLAAACDEIHCGQSAMLGSISAMCAILDESKAFEMEGLQMQVFTDGALKGAGIEGTSLTPAQRSDIQGRVEHIGSMFKTFMQARRPGITPEIMQGQWFYGDQALANGLADAIHPTLAHCIASLM